MRFQSAERGNQNARRGFLADPAPAPALLESPFLERALPAEDMPEAGSRRRSDPAGRLDRAPHRGARRLDAQRGTLPVGPRTALAEPQMRQVERAQRVELSCREPGAEILARLSHARGYRAAPLHDRQRVDGAIGARGMAGGIADRALQPLDWALLPTLRRWPSVLRADGCGSRGAVRRHLDLRNNS